MFYKTSFLCLTIAKFFFFEENLFQPQCPWQVERKLSSLNKTVISLTVFATPCPFKSWSRDFVASLSTDGLFKLIDSSNGSTIFEQKIFAEKESYFSSPVIVGSKIVLGCRDNFLYCFDLLSSAAM